MNTGNGGPTRQDSYFLSPFMPKNGGNGPPSANQDLSIAEPRHGHAVCTHPPPLVPPFLLSQNLSPKDIAGCDIMKLKVSRCRYATSGLKGLTLIVCNRQVPRLYFPSRRNVKSGPRDKDVLPQCNLFLGRMKSQFTHTSACGCLT